jgi:hypothetical protein
MLFQFKTMEDLAQWVPFADTELGGQSTSALQAAEEPQVSTAARPKRCGPLPA